MRIYQNILSLIVMMAIANATILMTGCPSKSTINKAISAAEKVDQITVTAIHVTNAAFNDGLITAEQKESLLPKLSTLTNGTLAFKNAALALKAEFNSEIPKDRLLILSRMLEADVVGPFLAVLSELKIIKNASKILTAISLINIALMQILEAFQKEQAISEINLKWREADLVPTA